GGLGRRCRSRGKVGDSDRLGAVEADGHGVAFDGDAEDVRQAVPGKAGGGVGARQRGREFEVALQLAHDHLPEVVVDLDAVAGQLGGGVDAGANVDAVAGAAQEGGGGGDRV